MYKYLKRISILLTAIVAMGKTMAQVNAPSSGNTVGAATSTVIVPGPAAYNSCGATVTVNYVRTRQAIAPSQTDETTFAGADNTKVKEVTQYIDGLGRPWQTVSRQASPNGHDIVSPVVYDDYNRESYKYLPYTDESTSDGKFKLDPFNNTNSNSQPNFLSSQYSGESVFYGKTTFESSPLQRPIASFAPGNSWAGSEGTSTQHAINNSYLFNTVDDDVKMWNYYYFKGDKVIPDNSYQIIDNGDGTINVNFFWQSAPSNSVNILYLYREIGSSTWITGNVNVSKIIQLTKTKNYEFKATAYYSGTTTSVVFSTIYTPYGLYTSPLPINSDTYPNGTLYKTVTTDEAGKSVIEYKDLEGKVLLKKVQSIDDVSNSPAHTGWLCTYYVYNSQGLLSFVMPPTAVQWLQANSWDFTQNGGTNTIAELCFQYQYDTRHRMIAKKVPGAGWTYMVYDNRDRLVYTQDANLRNNSNWLYTLYDALNRPVQTGIMNYPSKTARDLATNVAAITDFATPSYSSNTLTTPSSVPDVLNVTEVDPGRTEYTAVTEVVIEGEAYFNSETTGDITIKVGGNVNGNGNVNTMQTIIGNPIPSGITTIPLTYTYYDNYDDLTLKSYSTTNNLKLNKGNNLYNDPLPANQVAQTAGMVTGTRVRVIENPDNIASGPWLENATFYDDKARPIQTQSINYKGGTDITTMLYNFTGQVLCTYSTYNNYSGNVTDLPVQTNITYNHTGSVINISKQVGDGNTTTIVQNEYDELGQLKTKKIGQKAGSTDPLEAQDYTYNIRGWLKGINWDYSQTNSTKSSVDIAENKWFGMDLSYDWGFTFNQFNGNIAGQRWATAGAGTDAERAYGYGYDPANRLLFADFNQHTANNWVKTAGIDFSVTMGATGANDGTAYDANGNILKMQQMGLIGNTSSPIDKLTYSYNTNSNKLKAVTDAVITDNKLGDFTDKNKTDEDYGYDKNGNLITDLNKRINGSTGIDQTSGGGITYNHLNLPYIINVKNEDGTDKGTITYIYDAAGNKLQKIVAETDKPVKTTDYVGGCVYEDNTLQFFGQEEGRVRRKYSTILSKYVYSFDYFIKDHLGNTRMVLTDEQKQITYPVATLEDGSVTSESTYYEIDQNSIVDNPSIDATYQNNNGNPPYNPNSASNTTATSAKMYRIGGVNRLGPATNQMGLGFAVKVMSGDNVNIFGKSFWQNGATPVSQSPLNIASDGLLQLLTSFVGTPAVSAAAHAAITGAQLLGSTSTSVGLYNFLHNNATSSRNSSNSSPMAHITWILFDEQFRLVESSSGFDGVNATGNTVKSHSISVNIAKNGYLYVYCSNESNIPVFFDNLQVVHNQGPLLEETHYYPFGLTMAGISSKAAGSVENKRKYNKGSELQHEEFSDGSGLEWYDTHYRQLDVQLGRWNQIDPKCEIGINPDVAENESEQDEAEVGGLERLSPYNSMGNNPILHNDPNGDCPWCLVWGIAEIIEAVSVETVVTTGVGAATGTAVVTHPNSVVGTIKSLLNAGNGNSMVPLNAQAAKAQYHAQISAKGSNNPATNDAAKTGQEAHRQEQAALKKQDPKTRTEVSKTLKDGTNVRKDAVLPNGTNVIIKPNTKTGQASARKREALMKKNGEKTQTILYDPNDPKYQKGSPTYIGPK